MIKKIGTLEVLGYEEIRGVIGDSGPSGGVQELHPGQNIVVLLHVRVPGGQPFSVTLDGSTFEKAVLPHVVQRATSEVSSS